MDTDALHNLVRRDLFELFDINEWLLLPSPEMVDRAWLHCKKILSDLKSPNQQPHIDTVRLSVFSIPFSYLIDDCVDL